MIPRPVFARTIVAAAAALTLLAACGSDEKAADTTADTTAATTTTAAAPAASITVSDAWARTSPAVATAGAMYLTIANAGDTDDALIAAGVDPSIAATVEIHETVTADPTAMTAGTGMETASTGMASDTTAPGTGMMEMRPVDRIVVPANGSVALEPGGYHIMLIDLAEPLAVGTTVDVTLTFENAGEQVVTAAVRETAP